jgi:hypothetical protein
VAAPSPYHEDFVVLTVCIDEDDVDQLQIWFDELRSSCSQTRADELASLLSETLEGLMGIEPDILKAHIMCTTVH